MKLSLVLCQCSFDGCRSPRFILEKAQTKVWTPTGTRQNKVDRVLGEHIGSPLQPFEYEVFCRGRPAVSALRRFLIKKIYSAREQTELF